MKVKINFTLDIDSHSWRSEYGTAPADVRSDVQRYVEMSVLAHMEDNGLLEDKTWH